MREILREEKELKARKDGVRGEILRLCGGERMEFGIKVSKKVKSGAVDYKALLEDMEVDVLELERYRGPDVEYWEIRVY